MLINDIEQYKSYLKYLPHNSLLKIYNSIQTDLDMNNLIMKEVKSKIQSKTIFRYNLNSIAINKQLNTSNHKEVIFWLESGLKLTSKNNLSNSKFYLPDMPDYNWNLNDMYQTLLHLTKHSNLNNNYEIFINEASIKEYNEILIFSNGIIEYRYNKLALFYISIKDNKKSTMYHEKISFTSYKTFDEIKEIVLKILGDIELWNKYNTIDLDQYNNMLGRSIPCLAVPSVTSSLIHESIGHFSEADVFNRKIENNSYLGVQMFNKELNVTDYAHPYNIPTQYYTDDDGVECSDVKIITNGTIKGILSDADESLSNYYKIAGFKRGSLDGIYPIIRMRNTVLASGTSTWKEMLSNIQTGLILYKKENSETSYDGKFSIHISKAFLVINGQISGKLTNIYLTGTTIEFLKSISMIGNKAEWEYLMHCNKEHMTNFISSCSPAILCNLKFVK